VAPSSKYINERAPVPGLQSGSDNPEGPPPHTGVLIINADDWGLDADTTDRIAECAALGTVSSASAMVLMEDSERAADLARERAFEVGLHLNLTSPFTAHSVSPKVEEHHQRVRSFLRRSRLSQAIYHPGLANSFQYVVSVQLDEFSRLFGKPPRRVDGHHHMHLCANVLFAGLLPEGTIARRNFSFLRGEKSGINRLYRRAMDHVLAKRHRLTDYFFSLPPLEPASRLERIFALARNSSVEVETHPVNPEEYKFLTGGAVLCWSKECQIARGYTLDGHKSGLQVAGQ